jgi:hypothetical protein
MCIVPFKIKDFDLLLQMASQGDKHLSDLKKRLEPWLEETIKQEIQSAITARGVATKA